MVRFVASVDGIAVDAAAALPKVLLIGTKEHSGLDLTTRILQRLNPAADLALAVQILTHAIHELAPTADVAASAHVYLPLGATSVVSVTVAQLPTAVSRYNTLARPHAIIDLVRAHASGATIVALSLPDQAYTLTAGGFAVAKGAPSYSHKSSAPLNGVVTDGFGTVAASDAIQVVFRDPVSDAHASYLNHTADGIHLAQRLVDAPASELNTDTFVAEARAVASRVGASITVIRGEELRAQGFGGLYGVGKAAEHPPALVVLSYVPPHVDGAVTPSVALVGKGIVYDTGGLDLKLSGGMQGMKDDMGGAAGLLGGFQAAVLSATLPTRPLHCVLCLAENSVGPKSTRPDDIHTFYSGKTVEVNDTDAEGRLALGDGVAYAVKHLNPALLVDMATLTGAQGITTGNKIASVYANTDAGEAAIVAAGQLSGDLVHPVPYAPEFFRGEYASEIADMKNYMKNSKNAGVSCAGQFIGNHLGAYERDGQWLHVDMAYPVMSAGRATGFGVGLVQTLVAQYK
ncbi:Aste57867_20876 [Aphanomyces stellatus]|uniref:Aste57867_20876 protein n=1 Tax=Aphanomyces stellatus TaxID=120398 RepID=A0A485LG70_9STRA|nr:hypothetical protein As57867_020808 [Aphanomyces stellatus]VFT97553.1 Aste57867_20876 [Aphanomyces stellatus]